MKYTGIIHPDTVVSEIQDNPLCTEHLTTLVLVTLNLTLNSCCFFLSWIKLFTYEFKRTENT
jgi:hypothetical protein